MTSEKQYVELPYAPDIDGLRFRKFRGEEDYPEILRVHRKSCEYDDIDTAKTIEDIEREYSNLTNCDPYEDMLFAEVDGEVVGYCRAYWLSLKEDKREYDHIAALVPEWRGKDILKTLAGYSEERLRKIAEDHPDEIKKEFCCYCHENQDDWAEVLEDMDYEVVRYFFDMVRPSLEDIPEYSLPDGIEVRDVDEDHYRKVWEAAKEAFKDEWNEPDWQEEWYQEWLESPHFQPELWKIAWDGDEVVGGVWSFIDKKENEKYDRKRGYTESIFVREPWRGMGIAKALIARSFKVLKENGMEEAALGVDTENPSGALHLYKKMGFEKRKTVRNYRKEF